MTNKELLEWLDDLIRAWKTITHLEYPWTDMDEQAYQQLKSLLEAQEPTDEERKKIEDWIGNKIREYKSRMEGYQSLCEENMLTKLLKLEADQCKKDLLFFQKIRSLILAKPKVSGRFVGEKAKYIAEYPSQHRLEKVLQEAGVEVEE